MPQTDFEQYTPVGFAGLVADTQGHNIVTYSAGLALPFGIAVALGDDAGSKVVLPDGTKVIAGITVAVEKGHAINNGTGYNVKDAVAVLRQGVVWVKAVGTVKAGDKVFVLNEAGKEGTVGASTTAGGTTGAVELAGATFKTGGADTELVQVTLNLP